MSTQVSGAPTGSPPPPRRGFLKKLVAIVISGFAILSPIAVCITYVFTPLWKRGGSKEAGDGFRFIGKVGGLSKGGPPQLFQVLGIKKDAWTTYPSTALGTVFVSLKENGDLLCLNARCPHLGCTVGFQAAKDCFHCPCHTASFSLTGERMNQVPPRNLDALDAEIRNQDEIWVKFQDYRGGTEHQIPI